MNTTQAQQKALDDALVDPADRLEFGKCNMRLKTSIKPKEATFQVVMDALTLTPFYQAFLITAEVPAKYMQELWATIFPKVLRQRFEEPPPEHDILSFLRDLGHSGDIHYITDVSIDYLHQPWRAFATIINKCLSGKDTAYEKIHFLFQVENKDTKKTNKMLYPRFTKVIIDYFMSKDQSISRRNKMFWHTARDDTMFTSMRCVSRHEKSQVYCAILPQHLTNQAMSESIAYQTYYAYASGEKAPKEKYVRKKAESDTSPKNKTAPASKDSRLKSSAKVSKTDKKKQPATMPKTQGLAIVFEVALTKAEQIKLATKKSKTQFHSSYASGSGDGVDTQSKVHDEQQQKVSSINKGAGVRPEVPDVPKYDSESDEESWTYCQDEEDADEESNVNDDNEETESDNDGDDLTHPNLSTYKVDDKEEEEEKADGEEMSSDQSVSTPPEYELNEEEEENKEGDDKDKEGEQEQDEEDDMYKDVNINLERNDAEMTDAQVNQDTEDSHVILTYVPPVVQQQSSSVSSDLVSKFINPSPNTGIDSILNTNIQSHTLVNVPVLVTAETPSSDTTIPSPPIPIIQPLQQTPESTTTTTIPTTTLRDILNFASLLRFEQRVSTLETEMSEFKQTNQIAKAVSSILGIIDSYLASKMKETIDVDSTMKAIIKKKVQAQVSKIMPKIKIFVTESLEAEVLVRSTNQPQTSYAVAASLSDSNVHKDLYKALVESYSSDKDTISSYGDVVTLKRGRDDQEKDEDPSDGSNRGSQPKSSGKSAQAEEHSQKVDDLEEHSHQEFNTGNDDVILIRETLEDAIIPWDYFINNDLKYLKGESSSQKYTTFVTKMKAADYGQVKWIEEKVSRIWSLVKVVYDKHAYWGTYHWGPKRQKFYENASNMESSKDIYSRHMIIAVTNLKIMKYFGYSHLEEIIVRRQDDQLYKFREGDFKRLC
ncbi:hypothetical protein Tco_1347076 [Tanacetum coccineum]